MRKGLRLEPRLQGRRPRLHGQPEIVAGRVHQHYIEELGVHEGYLRHVTADDKRQVKMYERIDLCKLLMLDYAFKNKYTFCIVTDCFKNVPFVCPDYVWEIAKEFGIIFGARLENWIYIAHNDVHASIQGMLELIQAAISSGEINNDRPIDDYIYSDGPFHICEQYQRSFPVKSCATSDMTLLFPTRAPTRLLRSMPCDMGSTTRRS